MTKLDKQALREAAEELKTVNPDDIWRANKARHRFSAMIHDADVVIALLDELEAAEKCLTELSMRENSVHDLFLRAKAIMYQSGGSPVEHSLNPVDSWLFEAEKCLAEPEGDK